jgi:hypothetical protein
MRLAAAWALAHSVSSSVMMFGVGVAGDGQAGVAEQVLDVFEVAAGGFEVGGGAVA